MTNTMQKLFASAFAVSASLLLISAATLPVPIA